MGAPAVACVMEGLVGGSGLPSTVLLLCWIGALMVALRIVGLVGGSSERSCPSLSERVELFSEPEEDSMALWKRRRLCLAVLLFDEMLVEGLGRLCCVGCDCKRLIAKGYKRGRFAKSREKWCLCRMLSGREPRT
jgi:hypothetical protein